MDDSRLKLWMDRYDIKRLLRLVTIIIPLALTGNIIYLAITTDSGFIKQIGDFDFRYFLLAIGLALLPWVGQSAQILIWGHIFDIKLTPWKSLKTVLASDIGAAITPTMLGGGYAKLGFLISYGFNPARATLVTFLGSLADAVFFAIALPLAVYLTSTWENPHVLKIWHGFISNWPVTSAVGLTLLILLLIINKFRKRMTGGDPAADSKGSFLAKIRRGLSGFKNDLTAASSFVANNGKTAFLACVFFAGLGWCGRYGAITALVAGLGYPVDPILFFLLQWVVFTTMTVIPTPGAIGGAEVSFSLIYNGLIPSAAIPIVTAAWRFVTFYATVGLASIIFAVSRMELFSKENKTNRLSDTEESGNLN